MPAEAVAEILGAEVVMVGLTTEPVAGIDPGEVFVPDATLDAVRPSVLVIPGGFGCRPMAADPSIVERIREIATTHDGVLAVSTGTLLLAATGLLSGRRAAGHWLTRDELAPFGVELSERQIEHHGCLFTASGAVAGVEAAPLLVDAILYGPPAFQND